MNRWIEQNQVETTKVAASSSGWTSGGIDGALVSGALYTDSVAPRSTIVQPSAVHAGLCEDPARALEHLVATMVRVPPARP